MRVLKSFRVLRVVKMFRYLDSLQQIAKVLITSINSFAAIVVLLGLFWLVFSIVGLHVFGGLELAPPGWPNCDSLINSAILNFHVRPGTGGAGRAAGCRMLAWARLRA